MRIPWWTPERRRDRRPGALALVVIVVGLGGLLLSRYISPPEPPAWPEADKGPGAQQGRGPQASTPAEPPSGRRGDYEVWKEPPQIGLDGRGREPDSGSGDVAPKLSREEAAEVRRHFRRGVSMLHMRRYRYAEVALREVIERAPQIPEAHVNMGFALLGMERPADAVKAFQRALSLKSSQANAYYGLAEAREAMGDLGAAIGAMRTFVHLTDDSHPFLSQARAALWEWENRRGDPAQDRDGEPRDSTRSAAPGSSPG